VASDLSSEGIAEIEAEERMEKSMAEDALKDLEVELGMRAPEVTPVIATAEGPRPRRARRRDGKIARGFRKGPLPHKPWGPCPKRSDPLSGSRD
jgi:hypothetical protein